MPTEVICKACIHGPCKLGDLTRYCLSDDRPESVVTVQDMVDYNKVKLSK